MVSFPCPWEEALTGGPDNLVSVALTGTGPPRPQGGEAPGGAGRTAHVKIPLCQRGGGVYFLDREESSVETRVAVLAIIVRDTASVPALNELLHQYAPYIIGRMGVPYHARGVNIISVAVDAPADAISALSGKIGRLAGITAKTVYAPEDALQQGK